MSWIAICLIFLIGALNIAFNVFVQSAAIQPSNIASRAQSKEFIFAFFIGCTSLLALFALYASGIVLGRAILLMGTVSIIGGSIFGFLYRGQSPDQVEVVLLFTLALLFIYRAFFK